MQFACLIFVKCLGFPNSPMLCVHLSVSFLLVGCYSDKTVFSNTIRLVKLKFVLV